MSEKLQLVPEAGNSSPATPADPFDLDALRVSQDFAAMAGVKKQLITVPVRKPNTGLRSRTPERKLSN